MPRGARLLTSGLLALIILPVSATGAAQEKKAPPPTALSPQGCFSTALVSGTVRSVYETPHDYVVNQTANYWSAVGIRSQAGDDWDLYYYENSDPLQCVSGLLAYSNRGSGVDFVCTDFNHGTPNTDYVSVNLYSGAQPATVEWDDGPDQLFVNGPPAYRSTGPADVLEIWDISLSAGVTYNFLLQQSGSANVRCCLFENLTAGTAYFGRNEALFDLPAGGVWTFTPSRTDWYGLVVVNDNSGSGTYSIEVGTCTAPTTLVDGAAASINVANAYFQFTPISNYWTPIATRSITGVLKQDIYGSPSGYMWPWCFGNPLKATGEYGPLDLIVVDLNHVAPSTFYSHAYTVFLTPGSGAIQWEGQPQVLPLGSTSFGSVGPNDFVRAFDVLQEAGYPYNVTLTSSGPELNLRLYSSGNGIYWKSLSEYDWRINASTTVGLTWRAPASDYCGLVLTNDLGGSGFYGITFTHPLVDATTGVVEDAGTDGRGVAALDYDGDGDLDLLKANYYAGSRLFQNDGAGNFANVTPSVLQTAYRTDLLPVCADYDNDGDPDIYMCNNSGHPRLFRNDGGGNFSNVTYPPLDIAGFNSGAGWADYDRDGYLDLFVVGGANQKNQLFRGAGQDGFIDVTPAVLNTFVGGRVQWVDYDLDRDPDLFVYGSGCRLFRNDGGSVFTDVTSAVLLNGQPADVAAWGDYDNDGDPDVFIGTYSSTPDKLFRNNGGTFTDVTPAPLADNQLAGCASWGDWDNDGDLDLYVGNVLAPSRFFINDGGGVFVNAPPSLLASVDVYVAALWFDYNRDGNLDQYVVRPLGLLGGGTDRSILMRNDGYWGRHWIEVDLTGSVSTRDGAGARIRVVAGGLRQTQQLTGIGGHYVSAPFVARFGLGAATVVDSVIVYWPSGANQIVTSVGVDQKIVLAENVSAVEDEPAAGAPRVIALHAPSPNPFSLGTTVRFDLPVAAGVDLVVYDVSGRLVKNLAHAGAQEAGRHKMTWDGRDNSGHRVASGFYIIKLTTGDRVLTRKVVVAR